MGWMESELSETGRHVEPKIFLDYQSFLTCLDQPRHIGMRDKPLFENANFYIHQMLFSGCVEGSFCVVKMV